MIVMIAAFLFGFMIRYLQPQEPSRLLPTQYPTLQVALTPTPLYSVEEMHALEASLWKMLDSGASGIQTLITASRRDNPACRYSLNGESILELFTAFSCS